MNISTTYNLSILNWCLYKITICQVVHKISNICNSVSFSLDSLSFSGAGVQNYLDWWLQPWNQGGLHTSNIRESQAEQRMCSEFIRGEWADQARLSRDQLRIFRWRPWCRAVTGDRSWASSLPWSAGGASCTRSRTRTANTITTPSAARRTAPLPTWMSQITTQQRCRETKKYHFHLN